MARNWLGGCASVRPRVVVLRLCDRCGFRFAPVRVYDPDTLLVLCHRLGDDGHRCRPLAVRFVDGFQQLAPALCPHNGPPLVHVHPAQHLGVGLGALDHLGIVGFFDGVFLPQALGPYELLPPLHGLSVFREQVAGQLGRARVLGVQAQA